jgi:hypothetical protein
MSITHDPLANIESMELNEPIEVHYEKTLFNTDVEKYILVSSVALNGLISYSLTRPGGYYPIAIKSGTYPKKARDGWQAEVIISLIQNHCRITQCY